MKNTIWQPWSAKWITHVAFKSDDRSVSRTWSRHIVGSCHINFIKPKTYSEILLPKAYDSLHLWELLKVRKVFSDYYDARMTQFFTILCGLNAYLSPVTFFTFI